MRFCTNIQCLAACPDTDTTCFTCGSPLAPPVPIKQYLYEKEFMKELPFKKEIPTERILRKDELHTEKTVTVEPKGKYSIKHIFPELLDLSVQDTGEGKLFIFTYVGGKVSYYLNGSPITPEHAQQLLGS